VWELFTLFIFCNKETMALERLEILFIEGNDYLKIINALEKFDINNAHCFDPNEEYKLRRIIQDIDGGDNQNSRFKHSLKTIADEIRKSKRHLFYRTPFRWVFNLFTHMVSYVATSASQALRYV